MFGSRGSQSYKLGDVYAAWPTAGTSALTATAINSPNLNPLTCASLVIRPRDRSSHPT